LNSVFSTSLKLDLPGSSIKRFNCNGIRGVQSNRKVN